MCTPILQLLRSSSHCRLLQFQNIRKCEALVFTSNPFFIPLPSACSPNGTIIGTILAYDVEQNPYYFWIPTQECVIDITSNGTLYVDTSLAQIDYYHNPVFVFNVSISEISNHFGPLLTVSTTVTVTVTEVNQPPVFLFVPAIFQVNELAPAGTIVTQSPGFIQVYDHDQANSSLTVNVTEGFQYFDVVGSDPGSRCFGGDTCSLIVNSNTSAPSFDAGIHTVLVTVTVTDSLELSASITFVVIIVQVNEGKMHFCAGACM